MVQLLALLLGALPLLARHPVQLPQQVLELHALHAATAAGVLHAQCRAVLAPALVEQHQQRLVLQLAQFHHELDAAHILHLAAQHHDVKIVALLQLLQQFVSVQKAGTGQHWVLFFQIVFLFCNLVE